MHLSNFGSPGGGARSRARVFSLAAVVALLAMLLPATAGVVLGHDASANMTCSSTGAVLTVKSSIYPSGSYYTYSIDGAPVSGQIPAGTSDTVTKTDNYPAGSPTVGHSAVVQFYSSDNETQYDYTFTPSVAACQAHLILIKVVSGGSASPSSWTLQATSTGHTGLSGTTPVSGDVDPATYTLSESGSVANYVNGAGWVCGPTADSTSSVGAAVITLVTSVTLTAGEDETCTITNTYSPPTPTIATTASPTTGTVGVELTVGDTATLENASSIVDNPVSFTLYGPGSCTASTGVTGTGDIDDIDGVYTASYSTSWTPTAVGTYYWIATNTTTGATSCPDPSEKVVIGQATPAVNTTQQPASATVGTSIADMATVTGGYNPTGTVTFNLYSVPCATDATPLFTDTEPLSPSGTATSAGFTTTAVATDDYWVATYNGDSNNVSVSSGCDNEPVSITHAQPSIGTTPSAGGLVGVVLNDTATVSGGYNPIGTVTFALYGPSSSTTCDDAVAAVAECCGPLAYGPDAVTLVDGSATTSPGFTTTAAGTYYWTASYSGDPNNAPAYSGCGAESVVVTTPPPSNDGFFFFTKTVNGDLSSWTGGTFTFTVTCGTQVSTVSLTFPASGGSKSSAIFGPFTPGTVCTVSEGAQPAAAGGTWTGPTYSPSSSATIVKNLDTSLSVTDTLGTTPNVPTPTPTTTPAVTPKPTPSGGVLGATGKPSLPPTSSVPGSGGSPDSNNVGLLLAGLLGVSLALVVSTRLRGRLLERIDR